MAYYNNSLEPTVREIIKARTDIDTVKNDIEDIYNKLTRINSSIWRLESQIRNTPRVSKKKRRVTICAFGKTIEVSKV